MLRELYTANADQMATGVTPAQAEEKYRLNMAALVDSGQCALEDAPIILPGGVERNAKAKKDQEKRARDNLFMLQRLQQINAQIALFAQRIVEIEEALIQLKARELEIHNELLAITDQIALLEGGLDTEERAILAEIYGAKIGDMSDADIQTFLEDQQKQAADELDENERQQREKEAEIQELEKQYRELEQRRDNIENGAEAPEVTDGKVSADQFTWSQDLPTLG